MTYFKTERKFTGMYIEAINSPDDLKKLSIDECRILADEIRAALLKRMSSIGGHLGSNLGVVEATIALHYVFDSPKDQIVFDVSHQCYTHKILTGRGSVFLSEDSYKTYSGYTAPQESEHDFFRVGHTATSISLACGLAKARDLAGKKNNVIAFIGDGSLSGGEAMEGLNFGGSELNSNLIVVFNDNEMSIAENHGGFYKNLSELRESNGRAENNMFKVFGFDYVFVKDGNDVGELIKAFRLVKDTEHPVVVHICTTKGKGYHFAEERKEYFHWARPFDLETGLEKHPFNGERYDKIIRAHLLKKAQEDPKIAVMIAGVPNALSLVSEIRKEFGKSFIDVGIAEEHAVSMAAGIARNGGKPVFATLSTFFQRTYDQIFQELCINKCAATLIVVDASVYAVNDVTHVGVFDLSMMTNIPDMVCLSPTNRQEYIAMLDWSIEQNEYPVAIRAPRNGIFEADREVDTDYSDINKFKIMKHGKEAAIIALGDFYQMGESVYKIVSEKLGHDVTLINPRYASGIDKEMLAKLSADHRIVVTLEDGVLDGGFGQKIASFYGAHDIKVLNYGLKKEFLDRYDLDEVLTRNRLKPELIADDIIAELS